MSFSRLVTSKLNYIENQLTTYSFNKCIFDCILICEESKYIFINTLPIGHYLLTQVTLQITDFLIINIAAIS